MSDQEHEEEYDPMEQPNKVKEIVEREMADLITDKKKLVFYPVKNGREEGYLMCFNKKAVYVVISRLGRHLVTWRGGETAFHKPSSYPLARGKAIDKDFLLENHQEVAESVVSFLSGGKFETSKERVDGLLSARTYWIHMTQDLEEKAASAAASLAKVEADLVEAQSALEQAKDRYK